MNGTDGTDGTGGRRLRYYIPRADYDTDCIMADRGYTIAWENTVVTMDGTNEW